MKIDLAVIGQGAVSPAGLGVAALFHGKPVSVPTTFAGQPDRTAPVLRVDQKAPAFNRWLKEPRLRRTSPITLFMVEAAEQALAGVSPEDRRETGLVAAFSAGCLAYTHRFFEDIVKQGQKMASPALFPETVFNSPMSHVAAALGLNGAAYALVGDEAAWIAALKTAAVWLRQGRVKQVLILGAEEFDPLVLAAYRSARWLRNGFVPSEGAAALLVRNRIPEDASVPLILTARDGLIYRSRREASAAALRLLAGTDPSIPCYPSAEKTCLASLEKTALRNRPLVPTSELPYLGEAFTASAGWHTLRALAQLEPSAKALFLADRHPELVEGSVQPPSLQSYGTDPSTPLRSAQDDSAFISRLSQRSQLEKNQPRLLQPVWGLNHQFGLLELARANTNE